MDGVHCVQQPVSQILSLFVRLGGLVWFRSRLHVAHLFAIPPNETRSFAFPLCPQYFYTLVQIQRSATRKQFRYKELLRVARRQSVCRIQRAYVCIQRKASTSRRSGGRDYGITNTNSRIVHQICMCGLAEGLCPMPCVHPVSYRNPNPAC